MAKRYYTHSNIDGYKVKFSTDETYHDNQAFIYGLGRTVYGKSSKEVSDKVRAIIAENPLKVATNPFEAGARFVRYNKSGKPLW